jgi:hypothetical protein
MTVAIIILVVLAIIGYNLKKNYKYEIGGELLMLLSCALIAIALIIIPCERADYNSDLRSLQAFRQTIKDARSDSSAFIERAALTQNVAKWNEWIAQTNYWNTIFDICIPDECVNQEPIK